ncbi:hypothetical protein EAX61_05725 [Dokdonia sinensis]|uniref:Uncharacterized protein n=1 Tax=Dokdonia sinensis TaxID=2479847 RepID=A0A3M0G7G2_9FLAO|nr:hypothetical protein [Dokdonia sinensis]RMB60980.1 hypothetical protein EAX61_05725 [Dokdonia sinensis]
MHKAFLGFCFLALVVATGCTERLPTDHKLNPLAYEAIPYKGGEQLIFQSDSQQLDTIFITGTTTAMVRGGDPFSINPDRFEHLRIDYTTTRKPSEQGLLYLSGSGETYNLRFEFDAGHSRLLLNYDFYKSEYDTIPSTRLRIMDSLYTDVKTLHTEPYYEDRPERILNFYWSTSSGLLGWDTPTDTWRLITIKK